MEVAIAAMEDSSGRPVRARCEKSLVTGLRSDLEGLNRVLGREYFTAAEIGGHDIGLVVGDPENEDKLLLERLESRERSFVGPGYLEERVGLGPGHFFRWHEIRSYFDIRSSQLAYASIRRGWYPGPLSPDDCRWFTTHAVVFAISRRLEQAIPGGKLVAGVPMSLDWNEFYAYRAVAFCAQLALPGESLARCAQGVMEMLTARN